MKRWFLYNLNDVNNYKLILNQKIHEKVLNYFNISSLPSYNLYNNFITLIKEFLRRELSSSNCPWRKSWRGTSILSTKRISHIRLRNLHDQGWLCPMSNWFKRSKPWPDLLGLWSTQWKIRMHTIWRSNLKLSPLQILAIMHKKIRVFILPGVLVFTVQIYRHCRWSKRGKKGLLINNNPWMQIVCKLSDSARDYILCLQDLSSWIKLMDRVNKIFRNIDIR